MASYAIPPVREPSPITAMTSLSSPFISLAAAMPQASERDVVECPVSKMSCSDSFAFGKPLIPPN